MKNAKVELLDVALKGCSGAALFLLNSEVENTVVATRCEFANSEYGAAVEGSLTTIVVIIVKMFYFKFESLLCSL